MVKPAIRDDFYKLNGFDVVLIAAVICISLGLFLFTRAGLNWRIAGGTGTEGFVYNNGKLLKKLDLNQNSRFPLLNGKMLIEIQNGQIRVVESDCPQQVCINAGWINTPGQVITCLPNRILIEIESGTEPFLDAVAH
ncbi:MAG: NusG domain II-containing protein [Desulfosalsimonadaceae bacterium]